MPEPLELEDAKTYLRVTHSDEDAKIGAMIPRARLWVEDFCGLSLDRRAFTERHRPSFGRIRLSRAPLVSVTSVGYVDTAGADATYTPVADPPSRFLRPADGSGWPGLGPLGVFEVEYVAGYAGDEAEPVDPRLIGAMLALIEGEYSDGFAYPDRATAAAARACGQLRGPFA